MNVDLNTPVTREKARSLKAGDIVKITGTIYTARDAAHKRMLENREKDGFPIDIKDCTIYFAGPSPAKPGEPVGAIGPTTSYRMDKYSPDMIKYGETVMIGKGKRSPEVIEAMKKYGCVYIGAIGGAGALLASHVLECETVAYEDLGAEAVHRLKVKDFPGIVVIDAEGNNLYETEPPKYRKD
ncbi:MAG: Fe-S-containing hydro-lyase [Eubacterium sp.]|nr:Fe-S-containing hydro-lyase [Eubacterium sp.]